MLRWNGWSSWVATAVVSAAAVVTPLVTAPDPAAAEQNAPQSWTTSRYVVPNGDGSAEDQGYRDGCADGRAGPAGLRVLFYGTQESDGRIRPPGTTASSPARRVSEDWVIGHATGWGRGFTECGQITAVLALGVNNKSDGKAEPGRAGAAWAKLVERVAGAVPADRVGVTGALDGEPSWSRPSWARDWVRSYVSTTSRVLYGANSADGCPEDDGQEACANGWTVGDVHFVSTGAAATVAALPQIYRTDGAQARQWARVNRWGVRSGSGPLRLVGVLTQQAACRQRSGCARTANSPAEARKQLLEALRADPATELHSTDLRWPEAMNSRADADG